MKDFDSVTRTLPDSIANLDLSYLGRKLLDDDACEAARRNGERLWDEERVEHALGEYKQFLALMLWYPDAVLVPSEAIDDVWHTHVLNTARYQADCEQIFGRFQHHAPSFGESEEVQAEHLKGRDETLDLFAEAFGDVPESYVTNDALKCGRISADAKCGRVNADAKCGRVNAEPKCGRVNAVAKCGRVNAVAKCGRVNAAAKCGRVNAVAKCGRANAEPKCGRVTAAAKCGRVNAVAKCGRVNAAAKCGRVSVEPKCGRK